jgi:hypothetical protein
MNSADKGETSYHAIEKGEELGGGVPVLRSEDGEDYALTGDGISYPTMTGGARRRRTRRSCRQRGRRSTHRRRRQSRRR